jgi:hypothetical protein
MGVMIAASPCHFQAAAFLNKDKVSLKVSADYLIKFVTRQAFHG